MSLPLVLFSVTTLSAKTIKAGFGVPLFITEVDTTAVPDFATNRVITYTDLDEMTSAGFEATDNAYIAAAGFLSGQVNPTEFAIGHWDVTGSETVTTAYAAIKEEFEDFYFVTCESHALADVQALATVVNAENRMYVYSSEDTDSYSTAYLSGTDVGAVIRQDGDGARVEAIWANDADTTFPECNYIGIIAAYSPDTEDVVPGNQEIAGVSWAKQSSGKPLTSNQMNNLIDRRMNFVVNGDAYKGVNVTKNIVLGGYTQSGDWSDNIRANDCIAARVSERLSVELTNNPGGRFPGGAAGKARAKAAATSAMQQFVTSGVLESFSVDMSTSEFDATTRTLSNIRINYVFQGAVYNMVVAATASETGV